MAKHHVFTDDVYRRWIDFSFGTHAEWQEYIGYSTNKLITHGWEGCSHCEIKTLEGIHSANVGDWIIKGVEGELYPMQARHL